MDIDEPSSMAMNHTNEHQQTGMILFFAVTILSATFVAICSARQYFEKCCARVHPCCSKMFCQEDQEIHDAEQYPEDRFLAETLQRRFDEEERDRERMAKRKERRMWYEYYIKPWTMVSWKRSKRTWSNATLKCYRSISFPVLTSFYFRFYIVPDRRKERFILCASTGCVL